MGGGGGGEGMQVEVPLSTGALEAMWREHEHGLRPVLQLADEPRMTAEAGPYRVALSDGGERLQPGVLGASLNRLVVRGELRRGTVVRVLEYFAGFYHNQRVIIVIQLEILHAECTLIRSPTIFEANATQHVGVSCSGGLAIHEPCSMQCTQQVISNSSCSPDKRVLDSSVTPKAESTVINLPFSECFCSIPAQSTVDAKMQQLSLNDHQNQTFSVTTTGDAFGPPGNSCASPMLASYMQDSPGLSGTMAVQLTPGAVMAISEHADCNGTLQPMLQVVDVQMVNNVKNPSAERFRMVLSDGVYTIQSMLTAAENMRVLDGSIQKGSVIHLQEFTCSTIHNLRIIIVTKLYVLQSECNIIGNPKPYEMRNQPNEQVPNFLANAAQANTGTYSSDPGMLGSSASPRPVQDVNKVPYGGSYGCYQGMMGPPIDCSVESIPNVASGLSFGTTSAHNNVTNVGIVQSNLQQPSLNSHQNPRFAVASMAGGSGAPGNTYVQPAESFYQQSPPVSKNDVNHLVPVAQLNPYQGRWTIKARVTSKTDLRHYNCRGAGKVFSFDLLDGQGGEIRVTCFNAQADQFFDLIEVDKVYLISKGSVKPANKRYNSLNHEYEITLDFRSSVNVCVDDDSNIPRQHYNFRQISEIENLEAGAIVDLIGIVTSVGPSATIIRKSDGSEVQKRNLQLKDMSGRSVEVNLLGKFCDTEGQQLQSQCDSGLNPVLALKGARVTEFSGRSVNTTGSTQVRIDPDFPEAEGLRQWYAAEGKTAACVSLSVVSMGRTDVRKTVAQIKDENLGRSEKPDFITVKGAISRLNTDNFCYPACTMEVNGRLCNRKVINNGDGTWQCGKCDKSLPNCEYRYMLQVQIQDHTGVTYATAFQEAAIEMIGYNANELYNIREEEPERFTEILEGVCSQQFLFKLKVFKVTYNDEPRVKCSIMRAEKLDPAKESLYLLGVINGLLQDDTGGSPSEAQGPMAYNAGLRNTGTGRSVPTSNSAYTTSMSGPRYGESANQFAQQPNTYIGAPTPVSATGMVKTCMSCGSSGHMAQNCPAGIYKQQPAASTASSYSSSQPHSTGHRLCFKCNQPGHFANSCPLVASASWVSRQ